MFKELKCFDFEIQNLLLANFSLEFWAVIELKVDDVNLTRGSTLKIDLLIVLDKISFLLTMNFIRS